MNSSSRGIPIIEVHTNDVSLFIQLPVYHIDKCLQYAQKSLRVNNNNNNNYECK